MDSATVAPPLARAQAYSSPSATPSASGALPSDGSTIPQSPQSTDDVSSFQPVTQSSLRDPSFATPSAAAVPRSSSWVSTNSGPAPIASEFFFLVPFEFFYAERWSNQHRSRQQPTNRPRPRNRCSKATSRPAHNPLTSFLREGAMYNQTLLLFLRQLLSTKHRRPPVPTRRHRLPRRRHTAKVSKASTLIELHILTSLPLAIQAPPNFLKQEPSNKTVMCSRPRSVSLSMEIGGAKGD